jgi:hypothetical protein
MMQHSIPHPLGGQVEGRTPKSFLAAGINAGIAHPIYVPRVAASAARFHREMDEKKLSRVAAVIKRPIKRMLLASIAVGLLGAIGCGAAKPTTPEPTTPEPTKPNPRTTDPRSAL